MVDAATTTKLQQQCDEWNAKHKLGTPVILTKDGGQCFLTRTRSPAEVLSGHSAVIWLTGVSGCYLLDRVMPLTLTRADLVSMVGEMPAHERWQLFYDLDQLYCIHCGSEHALSPRRRCQCSNDD